ncbi:MAG TPA: SpoIVB peptidase S55 domain-containing protein, partial [Actinomycetota bacterium]|nr:SpoIVB peptidase S55 domain-containing protein [Actinomycetota bacterium]
MSLLLTGVGATSAGAQSTGDCPAVMPTEDVRAGMIGSGVTVAKGRQRETFNVEVLGVMRDVFPGRDLIVVDTSGGPIDRHGGIWYGMSGSPVYIDGKLVGAIAFGLSFGPSTVGALTPADEMMKVLEYPSAEEGSTQPTSTDAERVEPSEEMSRRIASQTGGSDPGSFERLKVPVGVSGGSYRLLNKLSKVVEREGLPIVPYAGSSATLTQAPAPATPLQPGDNLVAALSYGDITFAGLGTATFTCNGRVLGFGHPFFWQGETTMGANGADSIVVGGDDFFTFEVASIAEPIGMIDQDRFAGLRATTAELPTTIPINSTVNAVNTGRTRDGQSAAVISEIVPFLSWAHVFDNIVFTMDQFSGGSSTVSWTINGTTDDGSTWDLSRSNMYTSRSS